MLGRLVPYLREACSVIAVTFYRDVSNPLGFADTWPAHARRLDQGELPVAPEVEVTEEAFRRMLQEGASAARAVINAQPKIDNQRVFRGTLAAQDEEGNNVTLRLKGRLGGELVIEAITREGRRP